MAYRLKALFGGHVVVPRPSYWNFRNDEDRPSTTACCRRASKRILIKNTAKLVSLKLTKMYQTCGKENIEKGKEKTELNDTKTHKNDFMDLKTSVTYDDLIATNRFKGFNGYKTTGLMLVPFVIHHNCLVLLPFLSAVSHNFWTEKQQNLYALQQHCKLQNHFKQVIAYKQARRSELAPSNKSMVSELVTAMKENIIIVPKNTDQEDSKPVCNKRSFCLEETDDFKLLYSLCIDTIGSVTKMRTKLKSDASTS